MEGSGKEGEELEGEREKGSNEDRISVELPEEIAGEGELPAEPESLHEGLPQGLHEESTNEVAEERPTKGTQGGQGSEERSAAGFPHHHGNEEEVRRQGEDHRFEERYDEERRHPQGGAGDPQEGGAEPVL